MRLSFGVGGARGVPRRYDALGAPFSVPSDDRRPHFYLVDLADKEMAYLKRMNWRDFSKHVSGRRNVSTIQVPCAPPACPVP